MRSDHTSPARIRLGLSAAALLLCSVGPAAQVGSASSIGPFGGTANAVLVDPSDASIVLAATFEDGLLRSTDGGATFTPYSNLPGFISHLQADPAEPATFYALVDAEVWRSLDAGANWSVLSPTLPSSVRSLAVAGDVLLANDVGTLWRSDDDGATWAQVYTETVLEDVAFAPSAPNVAYLGRLDGVDKSTDGGLTWTPTAGLTNWTKALAVDPTDEDVVYAAGALGAFDKSTDGGQTSTSITNGWSTSSSQFLEFVPGSTTALYGGALTGIYRTQDAGLSWQAVNQGLGTNPPIPNQLAFGANGDVLLATDGGYFTLSGGVAPWQQTGFATVTILDVTFGAPGGQRLAAGDKGVYRGNPGRPLTPSKFFFDFGAHTDVLVVDPDDATRWLAGGVGSFIDNAQIRVLRNDGQQAQTVYEEFGAGHVEALVASPADPDQMLAGVSPNAFGAAGIVRSTDRGQTWSDVAGTGGWPIVSIAVDPHDAQHAVAYFLDHAWAESVDGGASWVEQFGTPWSGTGTPLQVAFDPFEPSVWWRVTTGEGLWRSDDAGQTWTALGVGANDESELLLHPELEGHLWYSDDSAQVLYSTDRGESFDLVLGIGADAGALAFDETTTELLVGTVGASAWEVDAATPFVALGGAAVTSTGDLPSHWTTGGLPRIGNAGFLLAGSYEPSGAIGVLAISASDPNLPLLGGVLHVTTPFVELLAVSAGTGFALAVPVPNDAGLVGQTFTSQYGLLDGGVVLSDAVATTILP